jgi:uncharacterized Rmd1/YagE family protein
LPPIRAVAITHEGGAPMPASPIESRMARLEGAYEQVSQRLMNVDPRFDALDRRIDLFRDALEKKIDALEKKIDAVDAKNDHRFMWMVGIVVTTWLSTIASIYLHH